MKQGVKDVRANAKTGALKSSLFKGISILLPFVLLVLVEGILRVAGYGYNYDLFVPYAADDQFLVFNPHASRKYFVDADLAPTGNAEIFKKEKDPNTLRIFVLGESTTIGYPYFHNASFHRLIQYRLMNTFPNKKIEIINLSLTAVNSYTVLGFSRELPKYKPDAVLIYTGHNEYYGTLGVASTQRAGSQRWLINLTLRLREYKVMQWLTSVYSKLTQGKTRDAGTRMRLMVGQENIVFGSDLYYAGVEQFTANLENTLSLLNQENIPVFISTLVSNERGMRPFMNTAIDTVKYASFLANYKRALRELPQDSTAAYALFKRANEQYPQHARCNFYLGELAFRAGDTLASKAYFRAAVDFDALRFRAPSAMNEVIARLCRQ
ncbi:MAG TPA: SGNH/GDSL hydrolase family protein, partial [Chryseolinea sp.]|nr:SGNH/GDSL hydrolase family protein [Chryseolinea sp.]